MVESGHFTNDSTLTADEAYQWWAELLYESLAPQPPTYTLRASQRAIRGLIDVRSPDHPVRRMSVPDDFAFFPRMHLGLSAICATLGATIHARSIIDDMDGVAEPITPLGKLHDAWVRERGLPHGLEPHDHP
ncbi:MAG: hypothetical protein ACRD1G_18810 [Acidimicrobiales bacterium]